MTPDEQAAFFEQHAPELQKVGRHPAAALAFIRSFDDPEERRVMFAYSRRVLAPRNGVETDLDACLLVARAGIDEAVRRANELDGDERARHLDGANINSYNLAADLADCWPGDDLPRQKRHFEAGRAAAARCVDWRIELQKPPERLSMAYWAKGYHELRLGLFDESIATFAKSLALLGPLGVPLPAEPSSSDDFATVLGHGYLGLAEERGKRDAARGRRRYEAALAAFGAQLSEGGERAEDAQFGIDQLETAASRT